MLENGQAVRGDFTYRLYHGAKVCGAFANYAHPGPNHTTTITVKFLHPTHHTATGGDYLVIGAAANKSISLMAIYACKKR